MGIGDLDLWDMDVRSCTLRHSADLQRKVAKLMELTETCCANTRGPDRCFQNPQIIAKYIINWKVEEISVERLHKILPDKRLKPEQRDLTDGSATRFP